MSASARFPCAFKALTILFDISHFLALALLSRCVRIFCKSTTRKFCHVIVDWPISYGPRCDKTCLWDSNQSPQLQRLARKFACSKFRYDDTFQKAKNKGTDQSAQMHRLVCTFVFCKPQRQLFLCLAPYDSAHYVKK